jgi:hypothetical protein
MSQAVERPNRPEIIKLTPKADRPTAPHLPQAKADRPIQPTQRHRPKPARSKPQYGNKQPAKPLTAPDGSPMYQAIGCLHGQLQLQHRQAAIVTPEGNTHPMATIRDQRLVFWLFTHPDCWSEQVIDWHVYPRPPYGYTLIGAGTTGDRRREPGEFTIQGAYRPGRAEGEFVLFVGGNNPKDKGSFAFVTIQGELPDAVERQLWRCQCKLAGDRLVLVEALMLESVAQKS